MPKSMGRQNPSQQERDVIKGAAMDRLDQRFEKDGTMVSRRIVDEVILVPVRRKANELDFLYALNEVGARIWELIDGTRPLKEVRDVILREFEVSESEAQRDLLALIEQLQSIGAVHQVSSAHE